MARVSWSYCSLLLLSYSIFVVSAQRKNIQKMPILVPIDHEYGQVKGLYIKDNNNGELRFLANNANFQNALNNFINQQQNFLEQLRPTSNSANSNVPAISLNGNTITGLTGTTGTNGNSNGVTPIVVNLAGTNGVGATGNNQLTTGAVQALIPQIVGNLVSGQPANRRRPNRRPRPNVVILRPQG